LGPDLRFPIGRKKSCHTGALFLTQAAATDDATAAAAAAATVDVDVAAAAAATFCCGVLWRRSQVSLRERRQVQAILALAGG